MRVAFVGVKRPPSDLPSLDYLETFIRFHLELPWYYAHYSRCDVTLTFVEEVEYERNFNFIGGGSIRAIHESRLREQQYDVVVHWRKWYPDLYCDEATNVILSQDHSYSDEWKATVRFAYDNAQLDGILVFPMWHRDRVAAELVGCVDQDILITNLTLGVDSKLYAPSARKNPYHLLWASDPGRGLAELIPVFLELWSRERRFRLTVTYPDYVKSDALTRYASFLNHPAVTHFPSLRNGPELFDLFNSSGVLPYTSTFPEPSSRCHRQAMSAGSMVLYPPRMGTPSDLLEDGVTGIVQPIPYWADLIVDNIRTGRWNELGQNARAFAVSEDWSVQARRFFEYFSERA